MSLNGELLHGWGFKFEQGSWVHPALYGKRRGPFFWYKAMKFYLKSLTNYHSTVLQYRGYLTLSSHFNTSIMQWKGKTEQVMFNTLYTTILGSK
jgi:hypothetical protein